MDGNGDGPDSVAAVASVELPTVETVSPDDRSPSPEVPFSLMRFLSQRTYIERSSDLGSVLEMRARDWRTVLFTVL